MKKLLLLLVATMLFPQVGPHPGSAAKSKVIFYSKGSLLALVAGTKHEAFGGYIFDGQERIALLRYHRFFAISLPSGEHIFSASYRGEHPAKDSRLSLNLIAGKTYFIRADAESNSFFSLYPKGHLDEVSCADANAVASKIKPLKSKDVSPKSRPEIIALKSLPSCH